MLHPQTTDFGVRDSETTRHRPQRTVSRCDGQSPLSSVLMQARRRTGQRRRMSKAIYLFLQGAQNRFLPGRVVFLRIPLGDPIGAGVFPAAEYHVSLRRVAGGRPRTGEAPGTYLAAVAVPVAEVRPCFYESIEAPEIVAASVLAHTS